MEWPPATKALFRQLEQCGVKPGESPGFFDRELKVEFAEAVHSLLLWLSAIDPLPPVSVELPYFGYLQYEGTCEVDHGAGQTTNYQLPQGT